MTEPFHQDAKSIPESAATHVPADVQRDIVSPPQVAHVAQTETPRRESDFSNVLLGNLGDTRDYYFPTEIIGGCCPRIEGEEEEIVWNAAAEASDSERVHVVYQAKGDKIWYLAVRSLEMASHPNTWCPFASLLPGMKDSRTPPVCYTYYSDEAATMMTITSDGLQIHRGTSSVVRAKAERASRALGDAPVIELVPDLINKLTPVPWQSMSLFEDRARRILAALAVVSGISFAGLAFVIWFFATMAMISAHTDMKETRQRTEEKTVRLMQSVQNLRASPMREQLAKFSDLNDGLLSVNGFLEIFQIKSGKIVWRAIVPPNITSNRITEIGGQTLETNAQGTVIGNSREALTIGVGAPAGGKQ